MGAGMGGGGGRAHGPQGFSQQWQYQSSIDPEELFRKIFGDAFGKSGSGGNPFDDFAESTYGFGEAQEVIDVVCEVFQLMRQFNNFSCRLYLK